MLWTVLLYANGTVLLLLNATFAGVVANVSLPAPPLAKPYVALDGVPVPFLFEGDRVVVPLGGGGVVTVKYVPRLGELDGFLYFNLTTPDLFVIWAEAGVLALPRLTVLNFTKVGNDVIIVAKGPGALAYAKMTNVTRPPASTPQSTPTSTPPSPAPATAQSITPALPATTTTTPAVNVPHTQASTASPSSVVSPTAAAPPIATPAGPSSTGSPSPSGQLLLAIGMAAALAALAAVFVKGRRSGGGGATVGGLSEVDERILAYLRERGGAYESEIARDLGIPRTTVFRAVRRLEEAGLVVVEKRGSRNFVRRVG